MAKLKVLVCPAHYLLDDRSHGSEYAWPVGLMGACAALGDVEFTAVAGAVGVGVSIPGTRVVTLGTSLPDRESAVGLVSFVFSYTRVAVEIMRKWRPDVVHHLLPFRVGATFNPVILAVRGRRTIVGPVQSSHAVALDDEAGVSRGDYAFQPTRGRRWSGATWRVVEMVASSLSVRTLCGADAVLAANRAGADAVAEVSGVKASVVPFGVKADRFEPDVRRVPVGRHHVVFLVVAYLVARKRVDDVIRAVAIVASRRRDITLRIVGDGPERKRLSALALSLDIGSVCEFVGRVPHGRIVSEYHQADVLVSMSASETFGMSLVEAMACGLPTISSVNDGSVGIVEDGITGHLVPVMDVDRLARCIETYCSDRAMIGSLGRAGQARVRKYFAWDVIAPRIRREYDAGA